MRAQGVDSVPWPGFAVVAKLSHPDSGESGRESVEEAEVQIRCTHFAEDTVVGKALEGEGKCSDVRTSCTSEHWMEEGTSILLGVADTKRVEGGGHGTGDEMGEAKYQEPALVRGREQAQEDAGDGSVGVVEGNAVAEADNDHIHQVDSNQREVEHSFRIGSGEVEVHTPQVERVVGCYNGVQGVVVAAARCAHTNNSRDGRTECDREVVGSGKSGLPVAVAEVADSGLVG